ncbi:LysE family transporter [Metabacillus lacus]|uniref:LysE family transporter n=1 Tax=Metabacillus lacus TaxID=1983721 RepID=UPI003CCD2BDF
MVELNIYAGYILLGLTLAAPIGPVNSARIDKGLKNGFWHAWMVGCGSMVADGCYMLLVYMGLVNFLDARPVQTFLWLFGGFVLLYTGIESIIGANSYQISEDRKKQSLAKSFLSGFLLSISSPLSMLFWLGIYGSVLAETASSYGTGQLLAYSAMIFIGLALWDIIVAALASGFRTFLTLGGIRVIAALSGFSLVGFGLYFGYKGIISLFQ